MTEVAAGPQVLAGVKPTGRNAAWLVLERVTSMAVAIVVTVVIGAQLGATNYGRLAVGLSLLFLLTTVVGTVVQCLVRDVVTEPEAANAYYTGSILVAGFVTSTIVLIITIVVASTVGIGSETGIVTIIIAGSVLIRPLGVVDAWFQVRLLSRRAVIIRVSALLLAGAIRISLPLLGFGVVAVAWTYVFEAALASLGVWLAYRRSEHDYRWDFNAAKVRGLLKEIAPLLLATCSALIFVRLDQVMLAALSTLAETGVYAVASSMSEAPRFVLLAIFLSAAPRLLKLKKSDPERYKTELGAIARLLTLMGYGLTFGLIFIVAPLVPILMGPSYADATLVIIILALGTPIVCVGGVLIFVTNWDRLYREVVTRNLVAAAISISLNLVLLPRYGAVGAAITTVVAQLWVALIGAALARRTRPTVKLTLPALEPFTSARWLIRYHRNRRRDAAAGESTSDEPEGTKITGRRRRRH